MITSKWETSKDKPSPQSTSTLFARFFFLITFCAILTAIGFLSIVTIRPLNRSAKTMAVIGNAPDPIWRIDLIFEKSRFFASSL